MPTSSMSKMLTMYIVFDALKTGKLKMDDTLPVSERAWRQEGSRMFLNVGEKAKVEDLIRGVAVQSGNDASVVLAEGLASGSESAFADLMNAKAKELGLHNSHFTNSTGLPDPQHYSTAHDLGMLAIALQRDFPEYYHYFSEISFTYNKYLAGQSQSSALPQYECRRHQNGPYGRWRIRSCGFFHSGWTADGFGAERHEGHAVPRR